MNLNEMIVIDLPSLQSITLGYETLYGMWDYSCSLIMRSNNEMIEMIECRSSKSNIHQFRRTYFPIFSFSDIGKYF